MTTVPDDPADYPRSTAVDQLERLGLSTDAARTFVALVGLGDGTAQDVSEVADVPRTRVYDAAAELQERGLVDVKRSNPTRYWATSAETAERKFRQEYERRLGLLTDTLGGFEQEPHSTEQQGVWTVTGRDAVSERVAEFVSTADDEIVYVTAREMLTEALVDRLSDASDRGVSIRLGEMSRDTERRLERGIPDARPFGSIWNWEDTPAGRLLMTDREKTLVSVLVDDTGVARRDRHLGRWPDEQPRRRAESAVHLAARRRPDVTNGG